MIRVILCIDLTFSKDEIQYIDQVFKTECSICRAEKWHISRLGIPDKQFAKNHQKAILLIFCLDGYKYPSVIYASFASSDFQRHKLIQFRDGNIYSCNLDVFKQQGYRLADRKTYLADADKVCQYNFEQYVKVQLVAIV